jgi:hypothetical protein
VEQAAPQDPETPHAATEAKAAPESNEAGTTFSSKQQVSLAATEANLGVPAEPIPQPVESIATTPEKPTDAEVLAALAMLGTPESDAVTIFGGNGSRPHGPHWTAEPLPLETSEATLILEREMAEMFAVTAAFEAGRARAAAADATCAQMAVSSAHSPLSAESHCLVEPVPAPSYSADHGEAAVLNLPVVAAEEEAAFAAAASASSENAQAAVLAPGFTATAPARNSEQARPRTRKFPTLRSKIKLPNHNRLSNLTQQPPHPNLLPPTTLAQSPAWSTTCSRNSNPN